MGTPIDLKVVVLLAVGFVVGALAGSSLAVKVDKELLKKIFAVVLFYTAIRLLSWDAVVIQWFRKTFS
jgi:uncharacterized membrane protein YfcA